MVHVHAIVKTRAVLKGYVDGDKTPHESLRISVSMLLESEEKAREELSELEQEYDELFSRKDGIEWIKYDPTSREIESHVNHLVTNGNRVAIAVRASVPGAGRYSWMIDDTLIDWVTHYAKINLPG